MPEVNNIRYTNALWYAWGQIDAGVGAGVLGLDDGFAFALEQETAAREFHAGKRSSIESISRGWADYVQNKTATPKERT